MGRKFFIINWAFIYGTASSNRLLAYANDASGRGYNVEIVSLLSLDLKDYQPQNGVSIKGLFPCQIHKGFLAKIISFFTTLWFLVTVVHKDDMVLLYGSADYLPLFALFRRKQTWLELTECPDLFHPKTYPFVLYEQLWKRIKGIIVISANLKQYFVDHGVDSNKVHVINMIVDPSRFDGVERALNIKKYVAYCGIIVEDSKDGVEDLLRAFAEYHKCYPDRILYIIGQIISESIKKKYVDYLISAGIKDCVYFTGAVSPRVIPQLFIDAEMLVLARPNTVQAKYGFPTKLGEYLLSGRPTVLTDVGNISDFLVDGKSTYMAEAGNIHSIASKMIEVSADSSYADDVGAMGKQVALSSFNSKKEVFKLVSLLSS